MGMGLAANDLRVSLDVGFYRHSVAIGLSDGSVLDEFEVEHTGPGFADFFTRVELHRKACAGSVAVAMEGYNGHARPLDCLVQERDYRLFNVNNLKLARFKEVFPAAAKTDRIDARKALELFTLCDVLPAARGVLQEVIAVPEVNKRLKALSRRREALVEDKSRIVHRMHAYLQAASPGMLQMTTELERVWFLNFLTSRTDLRQLGRMRHASIMAIPKVGKHFASKILEWQKQAVFSQEAEILGEMIVEDARRVIELRTRIRELEAQCTELQADSKIAGRVATLPGFGVVGISRLTGEIGHIGRFDNDGSLALYLGMSPLSKESGKKKGARGTKHVNRGAKAVMMTCVDRHRKCVPQSQQYYDKKRAEGKTHNQAIRALGRQLSRVIFRMLKDDKDYEIRPD